MSERDRFVPEVVKMLAEAGWHPGRDVRESLRLPADFELFPAAERVLSEFGNLKCGENDPGRGSARSTLRLDPSLAEGESDQFDRFSPSIGRRLYPLGEGDDGHFFVAIDDQGEVYILMDWTKFIGRTFDIALTNLLLGGPSVEIEEA
ncbi:MAG TPA: SUKH-3 domain-containing protein [Sphingomicrobium sp.]|nr:SUKH-3 domain-containing protein [Sphingomicrobium sp.]